MRVLLVTMFFPPTGGGSVQRPLKFAGHLADLGHDVHVIAPDDSKWMEQDETLAVPPGVGVTRVYNPSPSMDPIGPELYGRRRLDQARVHSRSAVRRLLVPDPCMPWALAALPTAVSLVRRLGIDVLLTTAPPQSIALVGAMTKRFTGVPWVADLRDSIVFHPHRRREVRGEARVARLVVSRADAVVAASQTIASELAGFGRHHRIDVIESGCDFDDFEGLPYRRADRFRITHTGNFVGHRDPRPFLNALASLDGDDVLAQFVGTFRERDRNHAESLDLGDRVRLISFVPRRQALAMQRNSDALLLLVPQAKGRGLGVVTGKVYEYLAAGRPILAAVPPDGEAAALIRQSGAGVLVPPDDVAALAGALEGLRGRWRAGDLGTVCLKPDLRAALARRTQVERLAVVLAGAIGHHQRKNGGRRGRPVKSGARGAL
jgi:glycosyltransferase involved in cell wall biosynthesis